MCGNSCEGGVGAKATRLPIHNLFVLPDDQVPKSVTLTRRCSLLDRHLVNLVIVWNNRRERVF